MEKDLLEFNAQKIYATKHFTIATILGGPLAAAYMASANFVSLGEPQKQRYAWGVAAIIIIIVMGSEFVPVLASIPNFFWMLLNIFTVQLLIHRFQAKKLLQHVENGGEAYPISRAIGVGLIFMVVLLVLIFGLAYLADVLLDGDSYE